MAVTRLGEDPVPPRKPRSNDDFAAGFERLQSNIEQVIQGKAEQIRLALVCLFAEGHLLIEDVPGVGKTSLAKSIARTIDCTWRRIQFTPDLLPTDVTGVSVFDQEHGDFEFRQGAVFANIVLGDEVNRASPKTQSALLEAMEERQVTVDGVTHHLPEPFIVMATQNPIEHEGTYPLPAAQLDRFLMRLSIGYPNTQSEVEVLHKHGKHSVLEEIEPVTDARAILAMIEAAKQVHVAETLVSYIVELIASTRKTSELSLGASPRASLALLRASRAYAASEGRDYVIPDDVKALASAVIAHRLIVSPEADMSGRSGADVVDDLLEQVAIPIRG
ncbi:MAG TPA: MoxR family ATPase [Actinomycetota bacterium]|nr:MoxR family ATPase [Actinomycetota bacterium]